MAEIITKLRYNPDDYLKDIAPSELELVARKNGVNISLEQVTGKSRIFAGHTVFEETWDVPFDQVSQTVITVSAADRESTRRTVQDLIRLYRSPVPIWGFLGSSKEGEDIAKQVIDQDDGW